MTSNIRSMAMAVVLTVACSALAQEWCPPGATWHYNISVWTTVGCGTATYLGDTVIGGMLAHQISNEQLLHDYLGDSTYTQSGVGYNSIDNGIVYRYRLSDQTWDTLYWLSAVPGDRWYPPGAQICPGLEPWGMVEVADTGTTDVNGALLRYVDVHYLDEFGDPDSDPFRIYERIGSPWMGLHQGGCLIVEIGQTLRTYSDDLDTFYDSGEPDMCLQITGLVGPKLNPEMHVFPNPGSDQIMFAGTTAPVWAGIHSLCGELVLSQAAFVPDMGLDTSSLTPGSYIITIRDRQGRVFHSMWIKE